MSNPEYITENRKFKIVEDLHKELGRWMRIHSLRIRIEKEVSLGQEKVVLTYYQQPIDIASESLTEILFYQEINLESRVLEGMNSLRKELSLRPVIPTEETHTTNKPSENYNNGQRTCTN